VAKNRKAVEAISVTFMTLAFGSVALIAIGFVVPRTISLEAFGGTNLLIFLRLVMLCTAIPSFAFAFASERLPSVVTAQFHSLFRCSLLHLRS
jgi:drug/metabolite transporter (DMT)-like permease